MDGGICLSVEILTVLLQPLVSEPSGGFTCVIVGHRWQKKVLEGKFKTM